MGTFQDYKRPNFMKLQDFKRKVYVIGVLDDPMSEMVKPDD